MNAVEKMLLSYSVLSGLNALYAICNNRVKNFSDLFYIVPCFVFVV